MRGHSDLCLDANVVIAYAGIRNTAATTELWRRWTMECPTLHAPVLLKYEVINAVHRMRAAGMLSTEDSGRALTRAFRLPIVMHNDDALHLRAFQLAADHELPATYESHYLALAERLGVDFWTADAKLANAVGERLPWVRLVA